MKNQAFPIRSRRPRLVAVALAVFVTSACTPTERVWEGDYSGCTEDEASCTAPDWVDVSRLDDCYLTLCWNGAGGEDSGSNELFDELCAGLPGVVSTCGGEGCVYSFYDAGAARTALDELLPEAAGCTVSLVGYSWGGVDAAAAVRERVGAFRLVLVDAYAPTVGPTLEIINEDARVWSYRRSQSTPGDCSSGLFHGLPIECAGTRSCRDYDVSIHDESIGHCSIVELYFPAVLVNVWYGDDEAAMESALVASVE